MENTEYQMHKKEEKNLFKTWHIYAIGLIAVLIVFNQWQISSVAALTGASAGSFGSGFSKLSLSGSAGNKDISKVTEKDLMQISSTAQSVKLLLPVEKIKTADDAIAVVIPTGIPEYGQALGVSYEDPVKSLSVLAQKVYPLMDRDLKQNDPETYQRYLDLATKPVGISCEFCCGIGPVGVTKDGKSRCGCQHNPAVLGLTMWLMKNTDYSDAEVLREVLKWKALFFPKDMIGLAIQASNADISDLGSKLPGMVGGC